MPGPVALLVLILAAFRLTRLAGWDTFPLALRLRDHAYDFDDKNIPQRMWAYELIGCAFCLGFWVSCAVYAVWLAAGGPGEISSSWVWWIVTPLAVSAAVGLIAKNLDA